MEIRYSLTTDLRVKLKQPLGTLIRGSFVETTKKIVNLMEKEHPTRVISVGDTVSKNLSKTIFSPQLVIIDNKCMRKSIQPTALAAERTLYVKNPPATITEEAIAAIQEALRSTQRIKMVVDGEEDLLTLIVIAYAPENSFVIYGQPYEGVVVVKVTSDKKAEIAEILKTMEEGSKT